MDSQLDWLTSNLEIPFAVLKYAPDAVDPVAVAKKKITKALDAIASRVRAAII